MVSAKTIKTLLLTCLAIVAIRPAGASQLTDEGMRLYNARQYEKAGAYFAAEIKANPTNATAQYLLGNAFLKLNRTKEAQTAYEQAMLLDPTGSAGKYSHQAKDALEAQALKSSAQTTPASGKPDIVDSDTKASAAAVSKQTDDTEKRLTAECDARVDEITKNSEIKIKQLQREMMERIAANGSASRVSRYNHYDPSENNQAVRDEYAPQIRAIHEDAQRQIDTVKASYKIRMAACESSAVTVDHSYVWPITGKVRLVPNGTSLYARNYQSDGEASGNAVPVLASPKRLEDAKIGFPK